MNDLSAQKNMIFNDPTFCMGHLSFFSKAKIALSILTNPVLFVLDKLGLIKNPLYHTKNGMVVATRAKTSDINDAIVVLSGNEYPEKLLGIKDLSSPVILDCGGHIGSFSLWAKHINPSSRVFVMEPVVDNLSLLKQNLELNRHSDVTVIPFALYGQSGHFYINLDGRPFDAGQVVSSRPISGKYFEIDALTLSEVLEQNGLTRVDLMKMDIEGSEYSVINTSLETLSVSVKRIIMEYHTDSHTNGRDEIVTALTANNKFTLIYESRNVLGFQNNNL